MLHCNHKLHCVLNIGLQLNFSIMLIQLIVNFRLVRQEKEDVREITVLNQQQFDPNLRIVDIKFSSLFYEKLIEIGGVFA